MLGDNCITHSPSKATITITIIPPPINLASGIISRQAIVVNDIASRLSVKSFQTMAKYILIHTCQQYFSLEWELRTKWWKFNMCVPIGGILSAGTHPHEGVAFEVLLNLPYERHAIYCGPKKTIFSSQRSGRWNGLYIPATCKTAKESNCTKNDLWLEI